MVHHLIICILKGLRTKSRANRHLKGLCARDWRVCCFSIYLFIVRKQPISFLFFSRAEKNLIRSFSKLSFTIHLFRSFSKTIDQCVLSVTKNIVFSKVRSKKSLAQLPLVTYGYRCPRAKDWMELYSSPTRWNKSRGIFLNISNRYLEYKINSIERYRISTKANDQCLYCQILKRKNWKFAKFWSFAHF